MMKYKKQWVQHISGQGEKWPVYDDYADRWRIWGTCYELPKSEYRLCAPPGVWKDVTGDCEVVRDSVNSDVQAVEHIGMTRFVTAWNGVGYRLRKVTIINGSECPKVAFIVEKKVSE